MSRYTMRTGLQVAQHHQRVLAVCLQRHTATEQPHQWRQGEPHQLVEVATEIVGGLREERAGRMPGSGR